MENNTIKSITFNTVTKKPKNVSNFKKEKNTKRVETVNWKFPIEHYEYQKQFDMIKNINTNNYSHFDSISKIAIQQINKKIYGYKQQDLIKKHYDENNFINLQSVIDKMVSCELKCYYCSCEMNVLYDISREMKQWSVDRIDNDLGHNLDNYYLACLECNLKRRRRSDDKFLFTKQLKLVKIDDTEIS